MKQSVVRLTPPWAQGKLPSSPAKSSPLPTLYAEAASANKVIDQADSGFVSAAYWRLGRCLSIAKAQAANDAEYRAWKISLAIPIWRLSRATSIAAAYRSQEDAAKATIKEAEDRVRDLRAAAGKKVHGSRFSLPAKVTQAEQAVTAIEAGLAKVKDQKVLAVEIRRLREIADVLAKLLAKYKPRIAAA